MSARSPGGAPGHRTSNGGGCTGGGVSEVFSRPAWQNVQIKSLNEDLFRRSRRAGHRGSRGTAVYNLVFLGKGALNGGTTRRLCGRRSSHVSTRPGPRQAAAVPHPSPEPGRFKRSGEGAVGCTDFQLGKTLRIHRRSSTTQQKDMRRRQWLGCAKRREAVVGLVGGRLAEVSCGSIGD